MYLDMFPAKLISPARTSTGKSKVTPGVAMLTLREYSSSELRSPAMRMELASIRLGKLILRNCQLLFSPFGNLEIHIGRLPIISSSSVIFTNDGASRRIGNAFIAPIVKDWTCSSLGNVIAVKFDTPQRSKKPRYLSSGASMDVRNWLGRYELFEDVSNVKYPVRLTMLFRTSGPFQSVATLMLPIHTVQLATTLSSSS